MSRFKRITDLFTDGAVLDLTAALGREGAPEPVWVNKPNSFEKEEARKDGQAARAASLIRLRDPNNPEVQAVRLTLDEASDDELRDMIVRQDTDKDFLLASDDIEADPE